MKVSFLIPTYNRLEFVKAQVACLKELKIQHHIDIEIVIGDNSTTEDISNYVQHLDDCDIAYFKNDGNVGYGKNVSNCYKIATGDYIWLLGDKRYPSEESFPEVLSLIEMGIYDAILVANANSNEKLISITELNTLVSTFGFRLSNLTGTILRRECLDTLDRCDKYVEYNFSHIGVALEYLASLQTCNAVWYTRNVCLTRTTNMTYWRNNVFRVFSHD